MIRRGRLLFVLLITLPAWSQTAKTTVLVRSDMDCKWSLDGIAKGVLKTDARLQVPVGLGQHLLEAKSLDGTIRWEKTFDVNDSKMQVWSIELQSAPWTDRWGTTWMRRDNGADVTWDEAANYCRNLVFAGRSDWRLATWPELESLRKQVWHDDDPDHLYGFTVSGPIYLTGRVWAKSTGPIIEGGPVTAIPQCYIEAFGPIHEDGTDGSGSCLGNDGHRDPRHEGLRALCVRSASPVK